MRPFARTEAAPVRPTAEADPQRGVWVYADNRKRYLDGEKLGAPRVFRLARINAYKG